MLRLPFRFVLHCGTNVLTNNTHKDTLLHKLHNTLILCGPYGAQYVVLRVGYKASGVEKTILRHLCSVQAICDKTRAGEVH